MREDRQVPPLDWAPSRLLETITDGISIQDRDLRIRYANRARLNVFGDDMIGKLCHEVFERRSQRCEGCPVKECMATGKTASAERAGFDENDAPWFAEIVATPLRGSDGAVVGAFERVRDITERKLIEQAADKGCRETAALAKIAMALGTYVDLQDVLDVALDQAVDICGAVGGLIRLVDEETGRLVARTWRTTTNQSIHKDVPAPQSLGAGVVGAAALSREIQIIDDLDLNSQITGSDHGRGLIKLGLNSMVVVPLVCRDEVLGTLALGSFERAKFCQADKGLLSAIAGQISISIENARLLQALRAKAKDRVADDRT